MYDADLPEVVENLKQCDGILLISNPCIEIWFIAHYKKTSEAELSSQNCVRMLKGLPNWDNYKKSILTSVQESQLWNKRMVAVANMEQKEANSKTYSSIFEFIKILEKESSNKN